jgi:hypothetical protein
MINIRIEKEKREEKKMKFTILWVDLFSAKK